ncbi:MAG: Mur ligase family protein [Saprospiraceae bacterium]|nr:Mur ligase family protein [Saprospiraceae bacterium]
MKIHLIAIGGSIMHNLAITLQKAGHVVSGSDDEIYNPARDRLQACQLLPTTLGWNPDKIDRSHDLIILGMHARTDNPELSKAQKLGLPIVSFPEFIYQQSITKTRVVVTGSHGKTTTTSMILHVLKKVGRAHDYLVGAQLEGFDTMVRLSGAPQIIIEGDEYLSSCLDSRPKILHYKPHIAVITGIAWDHMNVFPTFESYREAFVDFLQSMVRGGVLFYFAEDLVLTNLIRSNGSHLECFPYHAFPFIPEKGSLVFNGSEIPLHIFGQHNMANLRAAYHVLKELEVTEKEFIESIPSFRGAAKRLQEIGRGQGSILFQDFAHAPSKVKATIAAVRHRYPTKKLTALLELHTYSSLNKNFLPQYRHSMTTADLRVVFLNDHTMQMKKMPPITDQEIRDAFDDDELIVIRQSADLEFFLADQQWIDHNLLLMSSGTFGGLDPSKILSDFKTN